jgi:Fur family ferric uptake transcriptional regulator
MDSPKASQDDFKSLVRNAGLRSTSPRIAVLKALSKISTPMSHGELVDILAEQGFDRATIFRNLTDMTEAGLLLRIDVGDHTWRFEIKQVGKDANGHPHFVCTDCGEVACLTDVDMGPTRDKLRTNNKVGNISEVLLKGHCEDCGD